MVLPLNVAGRDVRGDAAYHGEILCEAAKLCEAGRIVPRPDPAAFYA